MNYNLNTAVWEKTSKTPSEARGNKNLNPNFGRDLSLKYFIFINLFNKIFRNHTMNLNMH